jgi:hypothetical protein
MTFEEVVLECCRTPDLIKAYDRLQGSNLSRVLIPQIDTRPPIVKMIDEATGYDKVRTNIDEQFHKEFQGFISFCFECVWLPLWYDFHKGDIEDSETPT